MTGPFASRPTDATVEHVEALVEGGRRGWLNEVAACLHCNGGRGCIPAWRYLEIVARYGRPKAPAIATQYAVENGYPIPWHIKLIRDYRAQQSA